MRKIKILGTGCANCKKLYHEAEAAARSLGGPFEIEKVEDEETLLNYNVSTLPALVVNGYIKVAGRVPSIEELKKILREEARDD